jgi:hypothetical protein
MRTVAADATLPTNVARRSQKVVEFAPSSAVRATSSIVAWSMLGTKTVENAGLRVYCQLNIAIQELLLII